MPPSSTLTTTVLGRRGAVWDYIDHYETFLDLLAMAEGSCAAFFNPPQTVRWNCHKVRGAAVCWKTGGCGDRFCVTTVIASCWMMPMASWGAGRSSPRLPPKSFPTFFPLRRWMWLQGYLLELREAGVPATPSVLVSAGSKWKAVEKVRAAMVAGVPFCRARRVSVPLGMVAITTAHSKRLLCLQALVDNGWDYGVVKPCVGASGHQVKRVRPGRIDSNAQRHLTALLQTGAAAPVCACA